MGLLDIFKKKKEETPAQPVDANGQVQVVPDGMQPVAPVVDTPVAVDNNAVPSTDFSGGVIQQDMNATPLMDQATPIDGTVNTEIPTEPTTIPVDNAVIDAPMAELPSGFGAMDTNTPTDITPVDNIPNQDIQPMDINSTPVDITATVEETGATIDNPIPAKSEEENMSVDLNAVVGEDITPQEIDASNNPQWDNNPFKEENTDITPPVEGEIPFNTPGDMSTVEEVREIPSDIQDINPTDEVVNLDSAPQDIPGSNFDQNPFQEEVPNMEPTDEVVNLDSTPQEIPESNFDQNPFQEEIQNVEPTDEVVNLDSTPQEIPESNFDQNQFQEEVPNMEPTDDVVNLDSTPQEIPESNFDQNPFQEEVPNMEPTDEVVNLDTPLEEVPEEENPSLENVLPEEDSVPDVQIPEIPNIENEEDLEPALDQVLNDIDSNKNEEREEPIPVEDEETEEVKEIPEEEDDNTEEVSVEVPEDEVDEEAVVEPIIVEEEEEDIFALPRIGDDVYPDIFKQPTVVYDEAEEEEEETEEQEIDGPVLKEESSFTIFDLPSPEEKKKKKKKKKIKEEPKTEPAIEEEPIIDEEKPTEEEEPIDDIEEVKGIEVNVEEDNKDDEIIIPITEEEKEDISDIFKKLDFKNEKIRFCENCGAMILGNSATICPSCGEPL